MKIIKVASNKKEYMDLLLLADEQENMINKYLEKGDMFLLIDEGVKAQCIVTNEGSGVYELKNIATIPKFQNKGYGKMLINYILNYYKDCNIMYVGTGDSTLTIPFYKKCGFKESHRVKNFFLDNYDHPIFENGKQLIDMVYLKWSR
ncbi:MAG: GNAT family N-acetyltransferase [Terrisporobacter othiniensis]|uniref:GNAT family N-acetyltransferase n=1 Tax=Terrisporobacter petrolearius TaxID=1460447 RepID=UPI0008F34271|nr:GNAT family N-acetyltransferase [Terrisporobacter petrolearius]MDU4860519.1 GNAT family N-acetyltransferase [Terrisporobacter othiniensis]MDU6993252.1 GNAT family N-acetyltransferase [Terrisporobacter othiniensis]SFJ34314.1 Acetyltransferase (GNAT) domain-containing protein [Terrisporobacter glycolicus]